MVTMVSHSHGVAPRCGGREEFKGIVRGWCLGSEAFRVELLAQVHEKRGDHYGSELRESDEARAEGLLQEELKGRSWTEVTLEERRKGDPQKVMMAGRLCQETTMTLKWIAQRLRMGTWTYVSNCL